MKSEGMGRVFSFTKAQQHKARIATPLSSQEPCQRVGDWTNQELSDVYRAVSCLGQAGILVDIDRGLTDEGDPWMVLCRGDGEVFIHFCRLDGRYLLDSPALAQPLRGQNFAELIDRFIAQAARAAAPNVVAFRASKVFLHPAALLTILVWSLYLWSSDTSEVHAGESGEGDPLPAPALSAAEKLLDDDSAAPAATAPGKAVVLDGIPADKWIVRLLQAVDYSGGVPAGNNIAAMHMLAVVGTLMLTGMSTHALDSDADSANAIPAGDVLLGAAADEKPAEFIDFREALAQSPWDGSDSARALIAAAAPADEVGAAQPVGGAQHIATVAQVHIVQPLSEGPLPGNAAPPELVLSDETPIAAETVPPAAPPGDVIELQTSALAGEFAALLSSSFSLSRYNVDGVSLVASFDPGDMQNLQIAGGTSEAGLVDLLFEAPQLDPAPPAAQDGIYGEAARAFINSFLEQSDDIQVMASANELVLIDLSAFDDAMDRAFAYSWSLEDGGTISTLGHYEFFASYALV